MPAVASVRIKKESKNLVKKNKDYCPEFAGAVKRRNMIVLCKLETCLAHIIICALRFASLPVIEHSIRAYLEILIFNAWVGHLPSGSRSRR